MISLQVLDGQSQPTALMASSLHAPPTLTHDESYHVFISYSSTDYQWTHSLIDRLESCGLRVCYHERDFTPGRTVLENMSDCIQRSQKVLLVLSPEFVRSRWCLLEANMSLFRDCLERKPIVPVLLKPGVSIPLHLCHLTYLEVSDPDFNNKLLKVLCTPNVHLQGSTMAPFQPPSIYNGKALQPLTAVNVEGLNKWSSGQFSDMEVPDQLRLVIEDHAKYREAVRIINSVYQNTASLIPLWVRLLCGITFYVAMIALCTYFAVHSLSGKYLPDNENTTSLWLLVVVVSCMYIAVCGWVVPLSLMKRDGSKYIVREMQKAAGQANVLLSEEKVLMGCLSNSKMYLVYVSLDGCKQEFAETFCEQAVAEDMFLRAVTFFSSGYACRLAKRHFPFPQPSSSGHLDGGICFCQYVSQQLSRGEWKIRLD